MKKFKKICKKVSDKFITIADILIPSTIVMVPIMFILFLLNIHGYLPGIKAYEVAFRLDLLYRYLLYFLVVVYIYKIIIKKIHISKSDIFLYIFIIYIILSTIFAYNKQVALYGFPSRYEGMFTLLFYCFLYLNCKGLSNKDTVEPYMKLMLGLTFMQFAFVILQLTGLFGKVITMYTSGNVIGLTENPNFLGSLMCTFSMLSIAGYMLYRNKSWIYFLITLVVSYVTLLLANSSGPFLSLIFTFIVFIIYLLIKKKLNYKKMIIVILILVTLYPVVLSKNDKITLEVKGNFITIAKLIKKTVITDNNENGNDTDNTSSNNMEFEKLGNGRMQIWMNTLKLCKKKPFLGYGSDNLRLVYEKSENEKRYADKAHNIYLNILVSNGIFALIGYLIWLFYCIYLAFKNNNDLVMVLCFGVIAYSVQGFFNINVNEVTPYFYILMGFMMLLIEEKRLFGKK